MKVNAKTLKITSKIKYPKNSINNRVKPVKFFDYKKDFRPLGSLKMELIIPKCVIPKINVSIPNFKLKYEEEKNR